MTCGQFFLVLLGAAPIVWFCIYYCLYRCFPWEKHMKAIKYYTYTSGVDSRYTFNKQYEWHKTNHRSNTREETTNLSFKTFKALYDLNPKAWFVQEEDSFGNSRMYFQLMYCKDYANIRVIFNKRDFNKYRRWLANRRKAEIYRDRNTDKTRSIEACQKIIAGAKKDIAKTIELANQELQEAKKITDQVKENLTQSTKKAVLTIKPHIEFDEKTQTLRYIDYDRNIYEIIGKGEWKDEALD